MRANTVEGRQQHMPAHAERGGAERAVLVAEVARVAGVGAKGVRLSWLGPVPEREGRGTQVNSR